MGCKPLRDTVRGPGGDSREAGSRECRRDVAWSRWEGLGRERTPRVRWRVLAGRMAVVGSWGDECERSEVKCEREEVSCGREWGVMSGRQRKCVRGGFLLAGGIVGSSLVVKRV